MTLSLNSSSEQSVVQRESMARVVVGFLSFLCSSCDVSARDFHVNVDPYMAVNFCSLSIISMSFYMRKS